MVLVIGKDDGEEKLAGCLLQAGIKGPQEKVIVCGLCPNRSKDVGNLGTLCKKVPGKG